MKPNSSPTRKSTRTKTAPPSRYRQSDDENEAPRTASKDKQRRHHDDPPSRSGRSRSRSRESQSRCHSRSSSREPQHSDHFRDRPHRDDQRDRQNEPTFRDRQHENDLRQEVNNLRTAMSDIQETLRLLRPANTTTGPSTSRSSQHVPSATYTPTADNDKVSTDTPAAATAPTTGMDSNEIIQLFAPTPRPVVTAGVGIAAHVPPTLREKIWRDEYVPLHQLLHQESSKYTESLTLALCPDPNNQLGIRLTKPKPSTLTLQQWEDAFLVYMAVYTERHSVCPQMCTYMRDVKDLARRGANFLYYDEQFRIERATTHCNWESVHTGLRFQAVTPFRAPQKPQQPKSNTTRIPNGYCHAFHARGTMCHAPKCRYKHTCPNCEERHPIYRCTKSSQNSQNRNVQNKSAPHPAVTTKPKAKDANPNNPK